MPYLNDRTQFGVKLADFQVRIILPICLRVMLVCYENVGTFHPLTDFTPLEKPQGMEHQYAQIATEIHAAEVMTYNACRMKENGIPFVKEASMVKLYASQVAEKAASKSIEWLGGVGFTQELLAEKFFRDCKVGSIYEGTSNIQLQTIAKRIKKDYQ